MWTAPLKSESNGVCELKIPLLDSFRNNAIKHSVSANNPDLLEVYSSKIQVRLPCKVDFTPKDQLEISLSVSSEESAEFSEVDPKLDTEIEGADLSVLFNEGFPPNKYPLDLPKELLSIDSDC